MVRVSSSGGLTILKPFGEDSVERVYVGTQNSYESIKDDAYNAVDQWSKAALGAVVWTLVVIIGLFLLLF